MCNVDSLDVPASSLLLSFCFVSFDVVLPFGDLVWNDK